MNAGTLPHTRSDNLPENAAYPDTGCHVRPRCLSCDLPRCIYDEMTPAERGEARTLAGRVAAAQGQSRAQLRVTFGVSLRTVDRWRSAVRISPPGSGVG